MKYRIVRIDGEREPFGEYRYQIFEDDLVIAHYWHDYRGEEHGIEFVNGTSALDPVGRMTEFMRGGGSRPLELSDRAVTYLQAMRE